MDRDVEKLFQAARALPTAERRKLLEHLAESLETEWHQAPVEAGIPGQLVGYWYASWETVPEEEPGFRPNGAILPAGPLEAGLFHALDLVDIDGTWFPLSESALGTYAHTVALQSGEQFFFVPARLQPWSSLSRSWRNGILVPELAGTLTQAEVRQMYGAQAAERARADRNTVQLAFRPKP